MSTRSKVKAIVVVVEDSNGVVKVKHYDPADTEALFFTDDGVKRFMGEFYKNNPKNMTVAAALTAFGTKIAGKLPAKTPPIPPGMSAPTSGPTITITDVEIDKIWNTPDESGDLLPVLRKRPLCLPDY